MSADTEKEALILDELRRLLESEWFKGSPRRSEALEKITFSSLRRRAIAPDLLARSLYGIDGRNQRNAARAIWKEVVKGLRARSAALDPDRRVEFIPTRAPYRIEFRSLDGRGGASRSQRSSAPAVAAPDAPDGPEADLGGETRPARWSTWAAGAAVIGAVVAGASLLGTRREPDYRVAGVEATRAGLRFRDPVGRLLADEARRVASMTGCPETRDGDGLEVSRAVLARGPAGRQDRIILACAPPGGVRDAALYLINRQDLHVIGKVPLPWANGLSGSPPRLHDADGTFLPNAWRIADLRAAEMDLGLPGDEIVVVLRHDPMYPSQILVLGWSEGPVVRSVLWSSGHLEAAVPVDMDRDGTPEVLAAGTNNDFQRAALVVLSLDGEAKRTPEGPRNLVPPEIRALPQTAETIIFPRTAVSLDGRYRTVRSSARVIDLSNAPDALRVEVVDAGGGGVEERTMIWRFDLRDATVSASFVDYDWYLKQMRLLIAIGAVEDRWNVLPSFGLEEYARAMTGEILYAGSPSRRLIPPHHSLVARLTAGARTPGAIP